MPRLEPAPRHHGDERRHQRHRPEIIDVGDREPAQGDALERDRRPQAHRHHEGEHEDEQHLGLAARALGDRAFGLHHQPGRAEQRIARDHAEAAQERERLRPVERPACERAVLDLDALDQPAQDQALAECGEGRAGREGEIPIRLAGDGDHAKLERHPAKDERQQHHNDGQIERRHDDGVGLRERDPEPAAAEHQPGLVAVPERRDRVHHLVALALVAREGKQDAGAEIEAVEDHVERDRGPDQRGPDHGKVPFHGGSPSFQRCDDRISVCASMTDDSGRTGVPISGGSAARPSGPLLMRRLM